MAVLTAGCVPRSGSQERAAAGSRTTPPGRDRDLGAGTRRDPEDGHAQRRREMVRSQLAGRDITDPRVLAVMSQLPRHRFVPPDLVELAYADRPLPIGHGQTISQPYIVGLMTQLVRPGPGMKALDIGTGSGYQAAVLARLVDRVYSIEIVCPLAREARQRLAELELGNVEVLCGDGYRGWPEHAPFDLIVVAAAPDHVPQPLVDQLAPGGRMVLPVGRYDQRLLLLEKAADGSVQRREISLVAFVPMTGEAEQSPAAGR
jgi:protein-L-isoaspartate(D-aspartate) O-methyltransferase